MHLHYYLLLALVCGGMRQECIAVVFAMPGLGEPCAALSDATWPSTLRSADLQACLALAHAYMPYVCMNI